MVVEQSERIVRGKLLDLLDISREIQHVTLLEHQRRRGQLLADRAHEPVVAGTAAKLHHIDSIFPVYVQIHDSLADSRRAGFLDMNPEQIVRKTIFPDKFLERLAAFFPVLSLLLRSEEPLCQRHENEDAHSKGDQTHRKEGEE